MACAIDASSPGVVAGATSTATAATLPFSPPAGALLVAVVGCNQNTTQANITWTMSSTVNTGLTWTTAVDRDNLESATTNSGAIGILVAQLPGSVGTGMTVSMTCNGVDSYWLKVYVVTGAASGAAAIGQVTEGLADAQQTISGTLTATVGNAIIGGASEWQASSPLSSTAFTDAATYDWDNGSNLSGVPGSKIMGTGAWDFTSAATTPRWTYAIVEILAAGAGPPPDTTVVDPGSDVQLMSLGSYPLP